MKKILIITGDPNSINSEIIFKSWKKINKETKKKIYFISNFQLMKTQFKKLKYKMNILKVENLNQEESNSGIKIIDIKLNFKNPFSVSKKSSSKFIINSL